MIKLFIFFIGLFFCLNIQAQQDFAYKDKFKMKNGNTFVGQLIRIGADTTEIELASGNRILFLNDQIKFISQYTNEGTSKEKLLRSNSSLYESDRNDFIDLSFGVNMFSSGGSILTGLSVGLQYKRRLAPKHFMMAGYGFEALSGFTSIYSHPVTLGYEFVLFEDRLSPYVNAKLGYAFLHPIDVDQSDFGEQWAVKGGYRYALGTGILVQTKGNSLVSFGLEYMVQDALFQSDSIWWGQSRRDVLFRRIFLKLGFTF